ncbi:hypothetical protein SAMN04487967_1637 [Natronorubrum sediminis]|uniref:Uncharacterized protein n=1 Tax=Natronorubrum sediminis TaxID=640943 RepID=A0A1H6FWX2_9EURY|nr:hypothetical protein [Natronorubrum sediminis]SEH14513.1 hypothetical protein SAMN04487967_1637 [Natronorubrum sediminis]
MGQNPVEDNFVTRIILGLAVIYAMMVAGGTLGESFAGLEIPYAEWIGVAVGAMLVFAVFIPLYRWYDASYSSE